MENGKLKMKYKVDPSSLRSVGMTGEDKAEAQATLQTSPPTRTAEASELVTDSKLSAGSPENVAQSGSVEDTPRSFATIARMREEEAQRLAEARTTRDERLSAWNTVIDSGVPARIALAEKYMKPQRDEAQEKRLRKVAMIQAIGDGLTALFSGIIGGQSQGYVPEQSGGKYAMESVKKLQELQERAYREGRDLDRMKLEMLLQGEAAKEARAAAEYERAAKEFEASRARGEKLELAELEAKMQREQADKKQKDLLGAIGARGETNKDVARVKEQIRNGGNGTGKNKGYSFLDGENTITLTNAQAANAYAKGVELGIIPAEGSKMAYTTRNSSNKGGFRGQQISETTREVAYNFNKQSIEERSRLLRIAYYAEKLEQAGIGEKDLETSIELLAEGFTANEIIDYLIP